MAVEKQFEWDGSIGLPAQQTHLHDRATGPERPDIARQEIAADKIDDDVDTLLGSALAHGCLEIVHAFVEDRFGAEFNDAGAEVRRRGGEDRAPSARAICTQADPSPLVAA